MKINSKIIKILLLIVFLICICTSNVYAAVTLPDGVGGGTGGSTTTSSSTGTDPLTDPDYYNPTGSMGNNTKFIEKANIIINILVILGTVIAVISLMAIGIKFMMGSTEEKAAYKETMVPYLIGAVMVFAIPTFLKVLLSLVESISF